MLPHPSPRPSCTLKAVRLRPANQSGIKSCLVSAWRHWAFSPCASFLLEVGWASGFKRTPCRQGFRHRVHNNTNTLCLLFPTRAACMNINDLDFWRGKGTKSVSEVRYVIKTQVRYNKNMFFAVPLRLQSDSQYRTDVETERLPTITEGQNWKTREVGEADARFILPRKRIC